MTFSSACGLIVLPKKDTFSWGHVGLQQAGTVLGTLPLPGQAVLAGIQLDKGGWKHSTNPALNISTFRAVTGEGRGGQWIQRGTIRVVEGKKERKMLTIYKGPHKAKHPSAKHNIHTIHFLQYLGIVHSWSIAEQHSTLSFHPLH